MTVLFAIATIGVFYCYDNVYRYSFRESLLVSEKTTVLFEQLLVSADSCKFDDFFILFVNQKPIWFYVALTVAFPIAT